MSELKCKDCRFYEAYENEQEDEGFCRRYPPETVSDTDGFTLFGNGSVSTSLACYFPDVDRDDWCGEFQPIQPPATRKDSHETPPME